MTELQQKVNDIRVLRFLSDPLNALVVQAVLILLAMFVAGVYSMHLHIQQQEQRSSKMTLKRIPIDDHPDLVKMIEDTYNGGRVFDTYVHKITIDDEDVNIEIDLTIDGAWGIHGTTQIGLDDENSVAEKLREIIQLEDGHD